jgi:hypothetical protein
VVADPSRVSPWRRAFWHQTAEPAAVARNELVDPVDEHRRADRSQHTSEWPRQPHLGKERHAAALVARNERPVAEDEPPAVTALVFRHGDEESPGFVIGEREQTQLTVPVDPGDDTRRPPTELSGAGVEEYRTREPSDGHVSGKCVFGHRLRLTLDSQLFKY